LRRAFGNALIAAITRSAERGHYHQLCSIWFDLTQPRNYTPLSRPLFARPFYGPTTELRTLSDAADFIANLPKHYSDTFHWKLAASTVEAACHSDGAKLVNSATEYMGKALVAEGMDR
jgi:hypothetical protein